MVNRSNGFGRRLAFIVCGCLMFAARGAAVEAGPGQNRVPQYSHLSVGLGYGIHYVGIGFNFEFNPRLPSWAGNGFYKYLSMGLGFGVVPQGGMGYMLSMRAYPFGRATWFCPRLTFGYGVVGAASLDYSDPGDERRAEGAVAGAGILLKLGRHFSLDGDALAIFPVDYSVDQLEEGGRFHFSAGLRFHF